MVATPTLFERLELKYLIPESTAERVRSRIRAICEPDRAEGGGYDILSLYLDTPSYAFHQAKLRDAPDRFKLRLRTYGEDGPAFLEIKRRTGDVIRKRRVEIDRARPYESATAVIPPVSDDEKSRASQELFAILQARTGAEPKLLVRYKREAWASTVDGYARVTFDREIRACEQLSWSFAQEQGFVRLDGSFMEHTEQGLLVLELKCESRMPRWMSDLVQELELVPHGYSKYSLGLALAAREALGRPPPIDLSDLLEA